MEILAKDFLSGKVVRVSKAKDYGFQRCYEDIVRFHGSIKLMKGGDLSGVDFIRHIKAYSDSLYGFHVARVSGDTTALDFFKEAYISCFAFELSSIFSKLGESRLRDLMENVATTDSDDEFYSERLLLRRYLKQWIFIYF